MVKLRRHSDFSAASTTVNRFPAASSNRRCRDSAITPRFESYRRSLNASSQIVLSQVLLATKRFFAPNPTHVRHTLAPAWRMSRWRIRNPTPTIPKNVRMSGRRGSSWRAFFSITTRSTTSYASATVGERLGDCLPSCGPSSSGPARG